MSDLGQQVPETMNEASDPINAGPVEVSYSNGYEGGGLFTADESIGATIASPWHTKDDTIAYISAGSLQIVGEVVLTALPAIEGRYFPPKRR